MNLYNSPTFPFLNEPKENPNKELKKVSEKERIIWVHHDFRPSKLIVISPVDKIQN